MTVLASVIKESKRSSDDEHTTRLWRLEESEQPLRRVGNVRVVGS